jgi:hypothetical protein
VTTPTAKVVTAFGEAPVLILRGLLKDARARPPQYSRLTLTVRAVRAVPTLDAGDADAWWSAVKIAAAPATGDTQAAVEQGTSRAAPVI